MDYTTLAAVYPLSPLPQTTPYAAWDVDGDGDGRGARHVATPSPVHVDRGPQGRTRSGFGLRGCGGREWRRRGLASPTIRSCPG